MGTVIGGERPWPKSGEVEALVLGWVKGGDPNALFVSEMRLSPEVMSGVSNPGLYS